MDNLFDKKEKCNVCLGSGQVFNRAHSHATMPDGYISCPSCSGTGIKNFSY